jgi:type I restriction enzyme R subunit
MSHQSEQTLENKLIDQLTGLGYERVPIQNEADLLINLKVQLEKHNKIQLTDGEFARILNHLNKGNIFEKAKILRDRMHLTARRRHIGLPGIYQPNRMVPEPVPGHQPGDHGRGV